MLEWNKERFLPWLNDGQIRYEHLHRYDFAKQFVKDKNVLDLGCGEGYGTFLLSKNASSIIGIDIDKETIDHAQKTYINSNLKYQVGSAVNLPKFGNKFDVVICFELIEHIKEYFQLIKSIKNLLKPSGTLLISTPNVEVYSKNTNNENPHHIREYSSTEFEQLLKNNFKFYKILHQKVYAGSFVYKNSTLSTDFDFLTKDNGKDVIISKANLQPMYFIGICSNFKINNFKINNLIDLDDQLLDYVYNEVRGPKYTKEIDKINNHVSELQKQLKEKQTQFDEQLKEKQTQFDEQLKEKQTQFDELHTKYNFDINQLNNKIYELQKAINNTEKQKITLHQLNQQISELQKQLKEKQTQFDEQLKEKQTQFDELHTKYNFDINQDHVLIDKLQESLRSQANIINDLQKELHKIKTSKIMKILRKIDNVTQHQSNNQKPN